MGYKSEVRCLIYGSKQDLDAFLTAQVIVGGSKILNDFKHQLTRYTTWVYIDEVYPIKPDAEKKLLHILDMHEPSTKWYEDYPEVSAWMAFMEEAPEMGLQFEFLRLGEERGNTEEHNSEKPLGFLYTSQPEILDDINKDEEIPILFRRSCHMSFQEFSGKEYLKIDVANNFGLDKNSWDKRIAWFDENEFQLHSLVPDAEEPALFYAGIKAWEKASKGQKSGYPISLDATFSGLQILAALACDRKAAELCNLVDVGKREDAYTSIYQIMRAKLGNAKVLIDRKLTKQAIMTAFYGSTATPKLIFGEGKVLNTFYETIKEYAPGAWEINEAMLNIWDDQALINEWVLPDNFHVKIKVMGQVREMVTFLDHPYEVTFNINRPIQGGRSLGANMVHSIDGMIVREMNRRCNYDPIRIPKLLRIADLGGGGHRNRYEHDILVQKIWDHYQNTNFLSARILEYLTMDNMGLVDPKIISKLINSLPEKPFQVISVHDCFRCLPNYGNELRDQYNKLLAMIAKSNLLGSIMGQITKQPIKVSKLDPLLADDIYATNYALS